MRITHYLYNAFIIEIGDKKIAIDPGAYFAYYLSFAPLIPKEEWKDVSHILVTHGDPDHYWHADRMAKVSGANFIVNENMVEETSGEKLLLGPRSKGLSFNTTVDKLHLVEENSSIEVDDLHISGIPIEHGPIKIKFGPFEKLERPGPDQRIGWGSIGYEINYKGRSIVNLGDTLLCKEQWAHIKSPDVLMIPIGGKHAKNTMDEEQALEAIKMIQPRSVIPAHYNCPMLFKSKYNPANDQWLKKEIEKMDIRCHILDKGESIIL